MPAKILCPVACEVSVSCLIDNATGRNTWYSTLYTLSHICEIKHMNAVPSGRQLITYQSCTIIPSKDNSSMKNSTANSKKAKQRAAGAVLIKSFDPHNPLSVIVCLNRRGSYHMSRFELYRNK